MSVAFWFGIVGAVVVLLGTFVLIGDHWEWFRRVSSRIIGRLGAIEKGQRILFHNSAEKKEIGGYRELKKGDPGFQEILEVIEKRTPGIKRTEIIGIHCGCTAGFNMGDGSVEYEIISLLSQDRDTPDALATREAVEQWLHDARVRSLSHSGFSLVLCGVLLGVVSLIMQALESSNC